MSNNEFRSKFNYNLETQKKSNPLQTNLSIVVMMTFGNHKNFYHAKNSIITPLKHHHMYLREHQGRLVTTKTSMIGFACNVHPDSIHVPSFQYTLNMKLQEHCSGQMRNTYENMSHRVGIELPAVLPPAQVYRQKILRVSSNKNSPTYHTDKVDEIAIYVPFQFCAVFQNMISNIAQIDPKFELCYKT